MSTRSFICIKNRNGSYDGIYCHFDGYPEGVGNVLFDHYNTEKKARELIENGDMSCIGDTIENCCFYHRDREEKLSINHFETRFGLLRYIANSWCEYVYEFNDGRWKCGKEDLGEILYKIKYRELRRKYLKNN